MSFIFNPSAPIAFPPIVVFCPIVFTIDQKEKNNMEIVYRIVSVKRTSDFNIVMSAFFYKNTKNKQNST